MLGQEFGFEYTNTIPTLYSLRYAELNSGVLDVAMQYLNNIKVNGSTLPSGIFLTVKDRNIGQVVNSSAFLQLQNRNFIGELCSPLFLTSKEYSFSVNDINPFMATTERKYGIDDKIVGFSIKNDIMYKYDSGKKLFRKILFSGDYLEIKSKMAYRNPRKYYNVFSGLFLPTPQTSVNTTNDYSRLLQPKVQQATIFKEYSSELSKGQMLKKFFSHVGLDMGSSKLYEYDSFNIELNNYYQTNYSNSDAIALSSNFTILGEADGELSKVANIYSLEKRSDLSYQEFVFNVYSNPKEMYKREENIFSYKKEKPFYKQHEINVYKMEDYKALVDDIIDVIKPMGGLYYNEHTGVYKNDNLETRTNEGEIVTKSDILAYKFDMFKEIARNYTLTNIEETLPVNYYEIGVLKDEYFKPVEANLFRATSDIEDILIDKNVNTTAISTILDVEKSKPSEVKTNIVITISNIIKDTNIEDFRFIINKDVISTGISIEQIIEIIERDIKLSENEIVEFKNRDTGISSTSNVNFKRNVVDSTNVDDTVGYYKNGDTIKISEELDMLYKSIRDCNNDDKRIIYHKVSKQAKPFGYFVLHIPLSVKNRDADVRDNTLIRNYYMDYDIYYDEETFLEGKIDGGRVIDNTWLYRPLNAPDNFNTSQMVSHWRTNGGSVSEYTIYDESFIKAPTKYVSYMDYCKNLSTAKKILEDKDTSLCYNKKEKLVNYSYDNISFFKDLQLFFNFTSEKMLSKDNKQMFSIKSELKLSKDKNDTNKFYSDTSLSGGKNKEVFQIESAKFSSKNSIETVHRLYEEFISRAKKDLGIIDEDAVNKMVSKYGRKTSIAKDYFAISPDAKTTSIDNQELKMIITNAKGTKLFKNDISTHKVNVPVVIESNNKLAYYISVDTTIFDTKDFHYIGAIVDGRDTRINTIKFVKCRSLINTVLFNKPTFLSDYGESVEIYKPNTHLDTRRLINEFNKPVTSTILIKNATYNHLNSVKVDNDNVYTQDYEIFIPKKKLEAMLPQLDFLKQDKYAKSIVIDDDLFGDVLRTLIPQDVIKHKSGEIHRNLKIADDWGPAKVDVGDDEHNRFFDSLALGPDDLIIPNIDYDYSELKKQLIDEETGRPIKPVAVIDANTFIGRFPTNHPFPEIPLCPCDKWVEVDGQLLKFLLEIANKIWRDNIFKFGAMDMRESVVRLLEYMRVFVDYRVPEQLHEQADRVLKLLRWYGESAVVRMANYEIKIEYEEFKAKLHLGQVGLPYNSENIMIDHTRYILKNINTMQDAMIEFEVRNSVETDFKFVSSFNIGELEVYVNNELIKTLYPRFSKESVLLPERIGLNPEPNFVKLVYKNSGAGVVSIGGIVIDRYTYKDITTTYSPKPGSGNQVMDDLMKKAASYAITVDENKDIVDQMLNNNLAIGEMTSMLVDYFNKHHANKHKYQKINKNRGKGGF